MIGLPKLVLAPEDVAELLPLPQVCGVLHGLLLHVGRRVECVVGLYMILLLYQTTLFQSPHLTWTQTTHCAWTGVCWWPSPWKEQVKKKYTLT